MGISRYKLHQDSITCAGITFTYRYYLSRKRRTLGMSVHPDGEVTVRAPAGVSLQTIRTFVDRHSGWIIRTRTRIARKLETKESETPAESGFLYQGVRYALLVENGERETVGIRDGELVVAMPPDLRSPERLQELCGRWYRTQALKFFQERLVVCHGLLACEQIPLPAGLVIRTMRSRWGSYSYRTRRICLNLNLIKAPPACLDYVLIHELCHAKVRHHGPDFWALVEKFVPDYRKVREQLKAFI